MKGSDVNYIDTILAKKESATLDFKADFDKSSIAKAVCSFLNGKGGLTVVGVKETGTVVGISAPERKASEILMYLEKSIIPTPTISVDIQSYRRKKVLVINVWQGTNSPYIYEGSVYYRRGASTSKATSKQLSELIHGKKDLEGRWEANTNIEVELDDIDINEVNVAIKDVLKAGRDIDIPKDPLQFLSKYHLYKNGDFTNGAVLMFGKEPVRYFPQSRVRLSVFKTDKTGEHILYDRLIEKNLFETVNQVTEFFDLAFGVASSFKTTDWKRNDKLGFPRLAIREAILNAVIHRDYTSYSSSIAVNMYPNKMEISSYGKFPKGITVKSLSEDHISVPVNPDIAHMFFIRRWIEKIGIGTVKMIAQCKEQGFSVPKWKVSGNSVTVTFEGVKVPFDYSEGISEGISEGLNELIARATDEGINEGLNKGITDDLKESMLEIIKLLIKEQSLRASDISAKLNKPYKTIERHIKSLRDINAIEFKGAKRAGGYILTDYWKKWM